MSKTLEEKYREAVSILSEAEHDKITAVKNGDLKAFNNACNYYARAKAECERAKKALQGSKKRGK
jgi:hypothetical protein